MHVLAVDTTSERGSMAFAMNGEVRGEVRLMTALQQSDRFFGPVEFLMKHEGFRLEDIDILAAVRGPGAFTGLRVGLAAMSGLGAALGKPVAGVSALRALSWAAAAGEAGVIAPTVDARRGEVYGALYRWQAGRLVELMEPAAMSPADWAECLAERPDARVCGSGALRYRSAMEARGVRVLGVPFFLAAAVCELVEQGMTEEATPLYVRRPDAELAKDAK